MQTYFAVDATTGLVIGAKLCWSRRGHSTGIQSNMNNCDGGVIGLYLDIPYTTRVRTSKVFPSLAVSGSLDPTPGILGNGAANDQSDSRP